MSRAIGGFAFAALIPGEPFHGWLQGCKDTVRRVAGPQRYLDDPPHLTLFVSAWPDLERAGEQVAEVLRNRQAPSVSLRGWDAFLADPLTGGNTLVCAIDQPSLPGLRRLQMDLLAVLAPLRDAAASEMRYSPHWSSLAPHRQASVLRYGFPFTGDDWLPHCSVASIAPAWWEAVRNTLPATTPTGPLPLAGVGWFALEHDVPRLLRLIPFVP